MKIHAWILGLYKFLYLRGSNLMVGFLHLFNYEFYDFIWIGSQKYKKCYILFLIDVLNYMNPSINFLLLYILIVYSLIILYSKLILKLYMN